MLDRIVELERQKAVNLQSFLTFFENKINILQTDETMCKLIERAEKSLDFQELLKNVIRSAELTDDKIKHALFTRMITERVKQISGETNISLTIKLACNAITLANSRQLKLLGLQAILNSIPKDTPSERATDEEMQDFIQEWLTSHLEPFKDCTVVGMDIQHLQSLNCLFIMPSYEGALGDFPLSFEQQEQRKGFKIDLERLKLTECGKNALNLWDSKKLAGCFPTSLGRLIGYCVYDELVNREEELEGWDEI